MRHTVFLVIFIALAAVNTQAGDFYTFKVSFKTLSCSGSEGYASVDADSIVRIQRQTCEGDDPIREVYQILVTGATDSRAAYDAFTTSEEEADRVMKKVDEYQEAKKKNVEEGRKVIIENR